MGGERGAGSEVDSGKKKVKNIHCPPFVHSASLLNMEVNHTGQAEFPLGKSMLIVPKDLLVFCLFPPLSQEMSCATGLINSWLPRSSSLVFLKMNMTSHLSFFSHQGPPLIALVFQR